MDAHDSVREKVKRIFEEIAPDRAPAVAGDRVARDVIARIKAAFSADYDDRTASTLGMHMSCWNEDAAFGVALHMFPERFTEAEIEAGVGLFLSHAPNHIRAACQITGDYVWENFPESDPEQWENAP